MALPQGGLAGWPDRPGRMPLRALVEEVVACCRSVCGVADTFGQPEGTGVVKLALPMPETVGLLGSSCDGGMLSERSAVYVKNACRAADPVVPPPVGSSSSATRSPLRNSTASDDIPTLAAEEERAEKARLQQWVKDFAREVVSGIDMGLMSPWTCLSAPYSFLMDRSLATFVLKPMDGSSVFGTAVYECLLEDVTFIYKGTDVATRIPTLGNYASFCVAIETRPDCRYILHFDDQESRDRFYTCLRLLRLSLDVARGVRASCVAPHHC